MSKKYKAFLKASKAKKFYGPPTVLGFYWKQGVAA